MWILYDLGNNLGYLSEVHTSLGDYFRQIATHIAGSGVAKFRVHVFAGQQDVGSG